MVTALSALRVPLAWQDIRLQTLEALGRGEEAQAFRWDCFERTLSDSYLRAYLKRLPDFDDMEAEERAMTHAKAYPSLLHALQFFLDWTARFSAEVTKDAGRSEYGVVDGR